MLRHMSVQVLASSVAVLVTVVGCGPASSGAGVADEPEASPTRATQVVPPPPGGPVASGVLLFVGDHASTGAHGLMGTITFVAEEGTRTQASTNDDGTFRLTVPAGSYKVTGTHDPSSAADEPCRADGRVIVTNIDGASFVEVHCPRT